MRTGQCTIFKLLQGAATLDANKVIGIGGSTERKILAVVTSNQITVMSGISPTCDASIIIDNAKDTWASSAALQHT